MELKLILLTTGTYLISLVEQLEYEPRCHLQLPHEVTGKTNLTLKPWPEYTEDEDILLDSKTLLTICDPSENLTTRYLAKIDKTLEEIEELTKSPESDILLNESGYEPDYTEVDPIY